MRPGRPVLDLPDLLQDLAGRLVRVGEPGMHGLGERLDGQVPGRPPACSGRCRGSRTGLAASR